MAIGGASVPRGYFHRPELTAERFVALSPSPGLTRKPSPQSATRFYRTGDLGRFREDGTIEFLGRRDDQIKLHGHRIELGEIESVLREHSAVQDCAVRVWDLRSGDQ